MPLEGLIRGLKLILEPKCIFGFADLTALVSQVYMLVKPTKAKFRDDEIQIYIQPICWLHP